MVHCAIYYLEKIIFNMQPEIIDDYYVTLLARHPNDKHVCDDKAR